MEWLALEAGDAATWGSTLVTFGMACYAIAQGRSQRRDLRRQNELQAEASQLQRRQIETAERRTLIMEDLLHRVSTAAWPAAGGPQGHRPGGAVGPPARSVPAQEPVSFPQGAPPPPPAADEDAAEADAVEADVAEQAEPVPTPRPAPAGPPGGYGYPQAPRPGPVPPGPVPAGPVPAGPLPAGDAGYGDPAPGSAWPPAPASPPPPWVPPQQAAPTGVWRVERVGRHGFALRNTGTTTLTGVRVGRANLPSSARGVPEDAVVRPGETTEFLMAAERGQPLPATVAVSWQGWPGEEHVSVPPG